MKLILLALFAVVCSGCCGQVERDAFRRGLNEGFQSGIGNEKAAYDRGYEDGRQRGKREALNEEIERNLQKLESKQGAILGKED